MKLDRVVLIVDDEADMRDILSELFSDLGWKIYTAENSSDALKVMEDHSMEISVVVSDYLMPLQTGIDFMRELRARGLLTPVVFFSANGVPEALIEAIRMGAADFCDKATDFSTLLNAAENAHLKWERLLSNARALAETSGADATSTDLSVDLDQVAKRHLKKT